MQDLDQYTLASYDQLKAAVPEDVAKMFEHLEKEWQQEAFRFVLRGCPVDIVVDYIKIAIEEAKIHSRHFEQLKPIQKQYKELELRLYPYLSKTRRRGSNPWFDFQNCDIYHA